MSASCSAIEFPHLVGKLAIIQLDRLEKALLYAHQNYEKMRSSVTTTASSTASTSSANPLLTQYFSILSRVYVGNINFDIKEPELTSLFSQFGGIKSINLAYEAASSNHKGYGFIEFDNTEAPTLAIAQMDGICCAGRGLKMGRPSNFPTELPSIIPAPSEDTIYLANIHEYVAKDDLMELAQSVGKVKSIRLSSSGSEGADSKRGHKGYCWIVFQEERGAKRAIKHLNGAVLAGLKLYACKTVTGCYQSIQSTSTSSSNNNVAPTPTRKYSAISLADSPVIVLKSQCLEFELQQEGKEAFVRDIVHEMQKYGQLHEDVQVFVDDRPEYFNQVHFFVRFESVFEADEAIKKISGRFFGGKTVLAQKYPLIRFQIRDFYVT